MTLLKKISVAVMVGVLASQPVIAGSFFKSREAANAETKAAEEAKKEAYRQEEDRKHRESQAKREAEKLAKQKDREAKKLAKQKEREEKRKRLSEERKAQALKAAEERKARQAKEKAAYLEKLKQQNAKKVAVAPVTKAEPLLVAKEKAEPVETAEPVEKKQLTMKTTARVGEDKKKKSGSVDKTAELKARFLSNLKANRLTSPVGNNALESIEALEKAGVDASTQRKMVAQKYLGWSRSNLSKKKFAKAKSYADKANGISKGSADKMIAKIEKAQAAQPVKKPSPPVVKSAPAKNDPEEKSTINKVSDGVGNMFKGFGF